MTRTLLGLVLLSAGLAAQSSVIHWTNANNGNWNLASNWDPNRAPSTNDVAVITNAGVYTVTLNVDPIIGGLILGGDGGAQTLATAGRTLTLNGAGEVSPNGRLLLSGGTLSGVGQIRLAGAMTWESGAIDTNATLVVSASGSVTLVSAGNRHKLLHGTLINGGSVKWQMYGNFGIGGTLHNLAGGVFEAQVENRSLTKLGDNARIINDGLFRKASGEGDLPCGVPFHNRGTVENAVGTLTLEGGSVLESGSSFTGPGQTRLGPGTHTLNGDLEAENLGINRATVVGAGRLSGLLTWTEGTLASGAALTVNPDGHLLFSSPGNDPKLLYGNLTNAGTVTFSTYGNLTLGGTFHNLPGGLFDVSTVNRSIAKADPAAVIINDGVFRRSISSTSVRCDVPIVNRGTLEVLAGTLVLGETFTDSAGRIALGGATLSLTRPLSLTGGLLTGWGTVEADVTNAGCIRPAGAPGVLTIKGKCEQSLGGRLEFELGGNDPGVNQSRLNITGRAILRGTVGALWYEGYVPAPGTEFTVLSFASSQGQFCCFDYLLLLSRGLRLMPVYTASSFALTTIAAPEPTTVPLRVTVDGGALVCWPAEFPGYELDWSTNLSQGSWTPLPGATHQLLEAPPLAREKFFRLRKP